MFFNPLMETTNSEAGIMCHRNQFGPLENGLMAN